MPKAVVIFIAGLAMIFFASSTGFASHENSGSQNVPISELWQIYSQIRDYQFLVRECGFDEFKGRFVTGDLAYASRNAAAAWQQSFPGVQISIETAPCDHEGNAFRNGINEIYWDDRPGESAEVGDYTAYVIMDGTLEEHDITIEPQDLGDFADDFQTDRHVALYNLMVHELGHALGLNDAYVIDLDGCDWSVMLSLCPGGQHDPQAADIEALQHIYGLSPEPNIITPQPMPTPSPAPTPPPATSLSGVQRFDLNLSGYIEDDELFFAVDLWTTGDISDEEFYEVTDAWIREVKIASLKKKNTSNTITAIEIYDSSGKRIASVACGTGEVNARAGRALEQHSAPTGVYISVVRDCETNRTDVTHGLFQSK